MDCKYRFMDEYGLSNELMIDGDNYTLIKENNYGKTMAQEIISFEDFIIKHRESLGWVYFDGIFREINDEDLKNIINSYSGDRVDLHYFIEENVRADCFLLDEHVLTRALFEFYNRNNKSI